MSSILSSIAAAVFSLLRKPAATVAELRDALASLDPAAAERAVDKLEAERRGLLLLEGSDPELDELDVRLNAAYRQAERQSAAKAELERQIKVAEEREARAHVEATNLEAQALQAALRDRYCHLHEAASALAEVLAGLKAAEDERERLNKILASAGRRQFPSPHDMLPRQAGYDGGQPNTFHLFELPRVADFKLPGFYPTRTAAADRLSRMKDLILDQPTE